MRYLGVIVLLLLLQAPAMAFIVVSSTPVVHETCAPSDGSISVVFSDPINMSTVTSSSFCVYGELTGYREGLYTYDAGNNEVTFTPSSIFPAGERVGVTLTPAIHSTTSGTLTRYSFSYTVEAPTVSEGSFSLNGTYATGRRNKEIVAADFDNDEDIDLAILSIPLEGTDGQVDIWLNDGSGIFTNHVSYLDVDCAQYIEVIDVDSDGDMDIVTVSVQATASAMLLYINDGAGNFTAQSLADGIDLLAGGLLVEDLDSDGDIDIALSNYFCDPNNLVVLHNNGNGSFGNYDWYSTNQAWVFELTANDVDNDGDFDILATNSDPYPERGDLTVHFNNGNGNFSEMGTCHYPRTISSIYMNDFNGDGNIDAAMGGWVATPYLNIGFNDGNGIFPSVYSAQSGPVYDYSGSDFNGDGNIDLCYSVNTGEQYVLLNNGSGAFSESQQITHSVYNTIAVADFNSDGRIDLVFAGEEPGTFVVYRNNTINGIGDTAETIPQVRMNVSPNPFSSIVSINLEGVHSSTCDMFAEVLDISGRVVCSLPVSGSQTITWNGRNNSGNIVPYGLYYCAVKTDKGTIAKPMLYIR